MVQSAATEVRRSSWKWRGEAGGFGDAVGEGAYRFGAGAFGVVHVVRKADDEGFGGLVGDSLGDCGEQVCPGVACDGYLEYISRRYQARDGVSDGEAGAFVAEVDAEVPQVEG